MNSDDTLLRVCVVEWCDGSAQFLGRCAWLIMRLSVLPEQFPLSLVEQVLLYARCVLVAKIFDEHGEGEIASMALPA